VTHNRVIERARLTVAASAQTRSRARETRELVRAERAQRAVRAQIAPTRISTVARPTEHAP